ncbi:MAG TPA: 3-keto-5-aminohexanoate cleavage protein [Baekduia sp.]
MIMVAPLIVEAAINGTTRPADHPGVPTTAARQVEDALACVAAGATVVHQHDDPAACARGGAAGMAALSAAVYRAVLAREPGALLYPTANFALGPAGIPMWEHHERLAADGLIRLAVFDPGAVALGRAGPDGIPGGGLVYGNSPADLAHIAARCAALGLGPSVAIFEPGFLRTLLAYHRAGRLPPGAFVKLYFGAPSRPFGLPPTPASLDVYLELMGDAAAELSWGVAVLGGDVVASGLAEAAIRRGGHVRVGLEDHAGPGAPGNAEQVAAVAALAAAHGRPTATPAQAAAILGLP